jgi:hypothetical protein
MHTVALCTTYNCRNMQCMEHTHQAYGYIDTSILNLECHWAEIHLCGVTDKYRDVSHSRTVTPLHLPYTTKISVL